MIDELMEAVKIARPAVSRILSRHDESTVEDALQSALLQACKNLHRFEHRSKLSTWFYHIAVREALMHLRRNKHETVELNDSMIQHSLNPEQILLRKESNRQLVVAVLSLSPRLRREALMRSEGNGPQRDNTRKARAFRMRARLRELMS